MLGDVLDVTCCCDFSDIMVCKNASQTVPVA